MEINLNLLPQQKKEEAALTRYFKIALGWEFVFSLIILTTIAFLVGIYFILNLDYGFLSRIQAVEFKKDQYKAMDEYGNKFKKINSRMALVGKIKNEQLYWSELFLRLSQLSGPGINLSAVTNKDFAVFLVGKASNRDTLLDFKGKLEGDECFEKVNLPLSDLVAKEDIDFQIDLKIKTDCLKKTK